MVKIKNGMKGIAPLAIGAMALYSCGDDEENLSNNDLLIGEWKILSIDGENYSEESDSISYSIGFSFEADGDFGYCYEYINNFDASQNENYCDFDGNWEWLNEGQTQLRFSEETGSEDSYILSIESISGDRMEGDYYDEDDPTDSYSIVFEKYDFEK